MTKPVAAVAAMTLVQDGTIGLDDPVDRWLPELADRRVLVSVDAALDDTVPSARAITVRDLLTMRMGFGIVMAAPDSTPIQRAMTELELGVGPPKPGVQLPPAEWMARLGSLPLIAHPGEGWQYQTAFCVLGVLLARIGGQPLETVLRERVFDPLGMLDTSFSVPEEKLDRLAVAYASDPETGALEVFDGVGDSQWRGAPIFPNAEGGLVSTIVDYLAFGRMLQRGGDLDGARILTPETVELLTTDQLTDAQREDGGPFLEGRGWGFGVAVGREGGSGVGAPGRFGWDGGFGTSWASDADAVAILMAQRVDFAEPSTLHADFWRAVDADRA
jgi:CubicO group peptidase (beta-lactamase class C family)